MPSSFKLLLCDSDQIFKYSSGACELTRFWSISRILQFLIHRLDRILTACMVVLIFPEIPKKVMGGHFKNRNELLNLGALTFSTVSKCFVWNFKGSGCNSRQNILITQWNTFSLGRSEILRASRLMSVSIILRREISFTSGWISDHIHCFMWDVISRPFPNFNGG